MGTRRGNENARPRGGVTRSCVDDVDFHVLLPKTVGAGRTPAAAGELGHLMPRASAVLRLPFYGAALSAAPHRGVGRCCLFRQVASGSEKERPVACRRLGPPMRESRPTRQSMAGAPSAEPGLLRQRSQAAPRCALRRALAAGPPRSLSVQVFVIISARPTGLASAAQRRGFQPRCWRRGAGAEFDLAVPLPRRRLRGWVPGGCGGGLVRRHARDLVLLARGSAGRRAECGE